MKTLLLDNHDSFSRILWQYLWEVNGEKPLFIRNDEWTLDRIRAAGFDNIVISPGPGHPGNARDFGVCAEVIRAFPDTPILGVCLGLQGLGLAAGAPVVPAPAVRHGKPSPILHDGRDLFAGLPQGFRAVRYHSLVVDVAARESRPGGLVVTATSGDDGQIMGLRLADRPCFGVQFHPESIGTEHGMALLANFRDLTARRPRGYGGSPRAAFDPPTAALEITAAAPNAPRVLEAIELPWRDPESAFARFFRDEPAAFWLDSLAEPVPGEPRVTYMGSGSRLIEASGNDIRILARAGEGFVPAGSAQADPFTWLDGMLRSAQSCRMPDGLAFPGSFLGGLIGWFGYGLKRFTEGNTQVTHVSDLPDAAFLQPDRMLVFDPGARKTYAVLPMGPDSGDTPSAEARAWLREVAAQWQGPGFPELPEPEALQPAPAAAAMGFHSSMAAASASSSSASTNASAIPSAHAFASATAAVPAFGFRLPWRLAASETEYLSHIRALQEAILRGETYEACLTNEWRTASPADPFDVYRILRRVNPAPYAAYLRFPKASILSASPERFLKLDAQGHLACRPIKGTRRRGATPEEDAALRADLADNAKDRSENLMIVDLVRNDFGKVCRLGSVRAPDLMKVEAHPTVLQLVSTVEGDLAEGQSAIEAVRACFPGGSMTGAPKSRTMELLEAREGRARGVFSGALGYLGWDGAMDLGMVIRTLVAKDGEFRIGCGGAILAESDPDAEFAEAMLKAHASRVSVELTAFGAAAGWKSGI